MAKKIFAGNWKLNHSPDEARRFVVQLKNDFFAQSLSYDKCEIVLLPSAFSLEAVSSLCAGTPIGFGPQNIYSEKSGAFTGENSAAVAVELKSQFALVGHSERREIFKEGNDQLNKKMLLCQSLKLTPIFCIGESLTQRQAGETLKVCESQLEFGLKDLNLENRLVVAYEPIWAIGTGQVATPIQVKEVHGELFKKLTTMGFKNFQLLYGGSVKPDNAKELLDIPHVDGFLIGGASLKVDSFLQICKSNL